MSPKIILKTNKKNLGEAGHGAFRPRTEAGDWVGPFNPVLPPSPPRPSSAVSWVGYHHLWKEPADAQSLLSWSPAAPFSSSFVLVLTLGTTGTSRQRHHFTSLKSHPDIITKGLVTLSKTCSSFACSPAATTGPLCPGSDRWAWQEVLSSLTRPVSGGPECFLFCVDTLAFCSQRQTVLVRA